MASDSQHNYDLKLYQYANNKLFYYLRFWHYGLQGILVYVIERIYDGSMVKFGLENIMTGWCTSDSGVKQGCPLSPLLYTIYVREFGVKVVQCRQVLCI